MTSCVTSSSSSVCDLAEQETRYSGCSQGVWDWAPLKQCRMAKEKGQPLTLQRPGHTQRGDGHQPHVCWVVQMDTHDQASAHPTLPTSGVCSQITSGLIFCQYLVPGLHIHQATEHRIEPKMQC